MKFFHLSDLHIGKQLHHYNMSEEQRHILRQIVEKAKQERPEAVLIAGDIYDVPVPSAEAVSIFDEFLSSLNDIVPRIPVLLIAGNHDSAKRIDFASSILAKHEVYIAGMPPVKPEEHIKKVTLSDAFGEVDFYLLPFVKPGYVRGLFEEEIKSYHMAVQKVLEREAIDTSKRNVILSHQFYTASGAEPETCDSEVRLAGGMENVDASVLEPFDYAALGHLHKSQKTGRESSRYCGTPLAYSVSEAEDEKSITMVELGEKGSQPRITRLPLHPLRRVRKLTGELKSILSEATEEMRRDFVSVTLTDEVEAYRPKESLEAHFDYILEIRIDNSRTRKLLEFSGKMPETERELSPYAAFCAFFEDMNGRKMTEAEDMALREVISEVSEVGRE